MWEYKTIHQIQADLHRKSLTVYDSLIGYPAISIPISMHSNGLPCGVQIIANKFNEIKLFLLSKCS